MQTHTLRSVLVAGALFSLTAVVAGFAADSLAVVSLPATYYRIALATFLSAFALLHLVSDYGHARRVSLPSRAAPRARRTDRVAPPMRLPVECSV